MHRKVKIVGTANYSELVSSDPEQLTDMVSSKMATVRYHPLVDTSQFLHKIKLTRLGEINVWHSFSTTGFKLDAEETKNSRFELHFVESSQYESTTNSQAITASAHQAYLLRNFNSHKIICHPQTTQLCVAIPEIRFARLATTEFDDMDLSALRDIADFREPRLQTLKNLAELLVSVGHNECCAEQISVGAHLLKEAFLALFIEAWPRDADHRYRHVAKPFYIKRAVDYIHANAAQKITLEELSSASGVSIRALQLGFRKFFEMSPMAYLLKIRLQRAHSDLMSEPAPVTIEQIAKRWGFSNPSKFAALIRQNFGVNPFVLRRHTGRGDRLKP